MFLLKKALTALMLPPMGPLLLVFAGLALAGRHRRLGRGLVAVGLFLLVALSLPWVSNRLATGLETAPPITAAALAQAQAIVVLGADTYYAAPEYGGDTVAGQALDRLRYGARLARQSALPVLVTGGAPMGGRPEAESMREALAVDFGVPARWVETSSRDTAENAALSAPQLKAAGISCIALVTHAGHMPRARLLFERQGLTVLPAPTMFTTAAPNGVAGWLPSARALHRSQIALHEWLGWLAAELS